MRTLLDFPIISASTATINFTTPMRPRLNGWTKSQPLKQKWPFFEVRSFYLSIINDNLIGCACVCLSPFCRRWAAHRKTKDFEWASIIFDPHLGRRSFMMPSCISTLWNMKKHPSEDNIHLILWYRQFCSRTVFTINILIQIIIQMASYMTFSFLCKVIRNINTRPLCSLAVITGVELNRWINGKDHKASVNGRGAKLG